MADNTRYRDKDYVQPDETPPIVTSTDQIVKVDAPVYGVQPSSDWLKPAK